LPVPTSYLTRIVEFTASHEIRRADWSAERNAQEFGKAAHEHSHHYECRVTVKGPLRAEEGGVVNLTQLDTVLREEIVVPLDGRRIGDALPEFKAGGRLATGEALAVAVWERIARRLPAGVTLHAVRVQEGPHIYSEYFGEP
jgi:6-pyruvoyltetrahydropterin/6-carboxytetrahydropterin synthase